MPVSRAVLPTLVLALTLCVTGCFEVASPTWKDVGLSELVMTWGGDVTRSDDALAERILVCANGAARVERVNSKTIWLGRPVAWKASGSDLELIDRGKPLDRLRIISRGPRSITISNLRGEVLTYRLPRPKPVSCSELQVIKSAAGA